MEYGEDLKAVKMIVKMMLKARKNLRMYPSNNPIYAGTLEETFETFSAFFSLKEKLVLTIRLHDIFYEAECVYHDEDQKDSNLAFFFFKDGLRELSFKKTLPFDELEAFLKVISADFENEITDDDTVTLFWENDFQHIRYVVEDQILSDDNDEAQAVRQALSGQKAPDKFKDIYKTAFQTDETAPRLDIIEIDEKDLELLARELEADAADKTDKFMDIIFEVLYKSRTREELAEVVDFFKVALEYAIKKGNFSSAIRVLKRLKMIAVHEKVSDIIKEHIRQVLTFAGSEHIVFLLGEYLDTEKKDTPLLKEMAEFFSKNAIPPFMNLLSSLSTIHARKAVIDILVKLGPLDFLTITKGLNSPEWYVVRNIIYVLREMGDPRAVEYLLKKIQHPENRVKIEVVRTLGELKDARAVAPIAEFLNEDNDAQLRYTAIRALGRLATAEAREILLASVREKAFDSRDFSEKKEYFQILSRWNDKEMREAMTSILMKKTLFLSAKGYEKKACAALGLGLLGSRDALPVLYKNRKSGSKLLQECCQDAIARIDNAPH